MSRQDRIGRSSLAVAFVLTLVMILGVEPTGVAYAMTINVNTSVDEDLDAGGEGCSLREAIIAANTDAAYNGCPKGKGNDTITFAPNLPDIVLNSNLPDVTSNITFMGPKAPVDTDNMMVVDGGGTYRSGFRITTANISLIRMAFLNGFATGIDDQGGAISQVGSGKLSISSSTFLNNHASGNGGAIFLSSTPSLAITSGVFADNTVNGDGGAIYVASGLSGLKIIDSTLGNNMASANGGAININGPLIGTVAIRNSLFANNHAGFQGGVLRIANNQSQFALIVTSNSTFVENGAGNGGVVFANGGLVKNLSVSNSHFSNNDATFNGGVFRTDTLGVVSIKAASFDDNTAGDIGGVIYANLLTGNISLSRSNFTGNEATVGGVILADSVSTTVKSIQIAGGNFDNNQVTGGGNGGVLAAGGFSGSVKISEATFNNNRAEGHGGALFLWNANLNSLTITGSTFTANSASTGHGGAIALGVPGVFAGMASNVLISKSRFFNNGAGTSGGAVYLQTVGKMSIARTTFDTNVTFNGGGGLHIGDLVRPATISNSAFVHNVTTIGNGGGLLLETASLNTFTIVKTRFEENRAPLGAGLYANEATVKIAGSYFRDNGAGTSGGAIYATGSGGALSITGSTFDSNFTNGGGAGGGVAAGGGTFLSMSKTLFIGNAAGSGSSVWFQAGEFHGNCFESNTNISVFDDVGGNDVTENWWEDPGGPNQGAADVYHTNGTPNHDPWLRSRPSSCPARPAS